MPKIFSHGGYNKYTAFDDNLALVLQSGLVQPVQVFFPSDISASDKQAAEKQLLELVQKVISDNKAVTVSYGRGVHTDFPYGNEEDNKTGALFDISLGWKIVGEHDKFVESQTYKTMLQDIEKVKDVLAVEVRTIPVVGWERNKAE